MKRNLLNKFSLFSLFKNLLKIAKFDKRRNLCMKYFYFHELKNNVQFKAFKNLKTANVNLKASHFRKKKLTHKIKIVLQKLFDSFKRKSKICKKFYCTILQIKIFKFLKNARDISKKKNEKKIKRFRQAFLKYKILTLLKSNLIIKHRERKILRRLKSFFIKRRLVILSKTIESMKKFYICEKFIKVKNLQKLTKIFYALKYFLYR